MFSNVLWERIISGDCLCQMAETPDYHCLYYWLLCSALLPDMCKLLHSSIHPKLGKKPQQRQVTSFFVLLLGWYLCCPFLSDLPLNVSRFQVQNTSLPSLHSLKLVLIASALPPSPHFLQLIHHLNKDPCIQLWISSNIFLWKPPTSITNPIKLNLVTQLGPEQHNQGDNVWKFFLCIRPCFETSCTDWSLCGQQRKPRQCRITQHTHMAISLSAQIQDCAVNCIVRCHVHHCHHLPPPLLPELRCPCLMPYWQHLPLKVTGTGQEKQGVKEGDPRSPWDRANPSPGQEGDTGEAQLKSCSCVVH